MGDQQMAPAPPPIPDTTPLQPDTLSNRHKRYIFFGIVGIIVAILIANAISGSPTPTKPKTPSVAPQQQQNPTLAQIQAKAADLQQQQQELLKETMTGIDQLQSSTRSPYPGTPPTAADLQREAALKQAQQIAGAQQFGPGAAQYANNIQPPAPAKSQVETEQEQAAYKSLFADNIVQQQGGARAATAQPPASTPAMPAPGYSSGPLPDKTDDAGTRLAQDQARKRQPLDFDPAGQQNYWLPEGTVLESVLTDRLDGEQPAPVNCMLTSDVYLPGTQILLIPQGSRVIGEARAVAGFRQRRLAVFFHRLIVPAGLKTYAIELDKLTPALSQTGAGGLHDKVDNHYASIFGASLAIGAIGGLAQIGNGYSGVGYSPGMEFRNGVSQSTSQSAMQVLDRFLNRMPTITIREGTRVRIILTSDLQVPDFPAMKGGV